MNYWYSYFRIGFPVNVYRISTEMNREDRNVSQACVMALEENSIEANSE